MPGLPIVVVDRRRRRRQARWSPCACEVGALPCPRSRRQGQPLQGPQHDASRLGATGSSLIGRSPRGTSGLLRGVTADARVDGRDRPSRTRSRSIRASSDGWVASSPERRSLPALTGLRNQRCCVPRLAASSGSWSAAIDSSARSRARGLRVNSTDVASARNSRSRLVDAWTSAENSGATTRSSAGHDEQEEPDEEAHRERRPARSSPSPRQKNAPRRQPSMTSRRKPSVASATRPTRTATYSA